MEHTTRQFSNKEPHAIETVKKKKKYKRQNICHHIPRHHKIKLLIP